jgi:tripartite-type tricarboxylate transporter receptor subunit TctC
LKILLLSILSGAAFALPAYGQGYPARTVTLVAPFPPGAAADIIARTLGDGMSKHLGRPVVVENKPGASGNIGAAAVARAAPDGYTVLLATINTFSINQHLFANMQFDAQRDFAPVTLVGRSPNVLVVNPQTPVHSVQDLIGWARANPGQLAFGSPGGGTSPHLSSELLNVKSGLKTLHVPYKGGAQVLTDLVGGQVHYAFIAVSAATPLIASGKLRALAVTSPKRVESLPNIQTMGEAGVRDFEVTAWFGLAVPAKSPAEVVGRLNAAARQSLADPDLRKRLRAVGVEPEAGTPESFATLIRDESERWAGVVKAAGIRAQ